MIKAVYNWTIKLSATRYALWALAIVAFAESSFFPIPPDIILIPMIMAKKAKAFFYAFVCTLSSVLGGIAGYLIGYYLFNSLGIKS